MSKKNKVKLPLTIDRPFKVMYWSALAILVFSTIIIALEIQKIHWLSIMIAIGLAGLTLILKSATVSIKEESIHFTYFFGLKQREFPLVDVHTVYVFNERYLQLINHNILVLHSFYLSKKNSQVFLRKIEEKKPTIQIEKKKKMA